MVTSREVANLFLQQDDPDDEVGEMRVATIRMDAGRIAFIDSMAEQAGVSRNVMANHLLGVGIGAVMAELPDVIRDDINEGVLHRMEDL